jgi:hypothetical protein
VLPRLAGLSNATKAEIMAEVCRDRASELFSGVQRYFTGAGSHTARALTVTHEAAGGGRHVSPKLASDR